MKKYKAFGLILSVVHSVGEKLFGLVKPEAEKFVIGVVFAGGLLAGRKNWPLVSVTSVNFLT